MKKIFILTGEPSGDKLASKVIQELKKDNSQIEYLSVGGENLKALGIKSIYDLNLGDLVSSYNSELDIVENVPIQQIIKPMHKNLYKVNNLILTEDHPVFDIDGKLLSVSPELTKQRYELNAEKLEIGHTLKTLNNEELIVEKIRRYNGEFKTYTILTKNNNFFVDGILVHSEINY